MKIAILITGDYRSFEKSVKTYSRLLQGNDVYFSSWSSSHQSHPYERSLGLHVEDITKERVYNVLEGYNVLGVDISDFDADYWSRIRYNAPMINRWSAGLALIDRTEIKYDKIIVIRPDLYMDKFPEDFVMPELENNVLYSSWFYNNGRLVDVLLIAEPECMKKSLMTNDVWSITMNADWHTAFHNHVVNQGITIKDTGFFLPKHTFTRPDIDKINSFEDAVANEEIWRNMTIRHQVNLYGIDEVRRIWSHELIKKVTGR